MGLFGLGKKNKEKEEAALEGRQEELQEIKENIPGAEALEVQSEEEIDIEDCRPGDVLFEIYHLYPLTEHDGGTELVGRLKHGEIKPGQRISYCDKNGVQIFNCTIESVEQKGHKLKKATAYCFGLLGPLYSLMITEFSANAFERGNYLVSRCTAEEELTELTKAFEAARMSYTQEYAVCEKLGAPVLSEEVINSFSIQENIFALTYTRDCGKLAVGKQNKEPWEAKTRQLYEALLEKVRNADELYLTYDKSTGFPFFNNGTVDVYSKKEYAEVAVQFYKEYYRELEVCPVRALPLESPASDTAQAPDMRVPAFSMFYFLGMEQVVLDNGFYRALIARGDILPPPDFSALPPEQVPVMNPVLRAKMIDFFQEARWKVQYEKHIEAVQEKERAMLKEITKAKLLLPIQRRQEGSADGQLRFAVIKNTAGESFIPLFADYVELSKNYAPNAWGVAPVDIRKAIELNQFDGVAINPSGENLVLKEKALKAIEDILANPDEEAADEAKDISDGEA